MCSKEPLAHVLRMIGFGSVGNLIGLAAALALPSVVLMMMFGQTRIFFTMARDGLLPEVLSPGPPEVPHPARDHDHHRHLRGAVRRRCSRSASWPTSPTRARCSPSSWSRSAVMILRRTAARPPSPVPHPAACGWSARWRSPAACCCSSTCRLYTHASLFFGWAVHRPGRSTVLYGYRTQRPRPRHAAGRTSAPRCCAPEPAFHEGPAGPSDRRRQRAR